MCEVYERYRSGISVISSMGRHMVHRMSLR